MVGQRRQAQAVRIAGVGKQVALAVANRHMHVHAIAGPVGKWLGHERAHHAQIVGDFRRGHLEQQVMVSRGQTVGVGVIDFKLAIGVFVVNLIDVDVHLTQRLNQGFQKLAVARQAFVVVAGLGQGVAVVCRDNLAAGVFFQQGEFRLQPGKQRPATLGQPRHLLLEHHPGVQRPRLTLDMAVTGNPRIARLPRHQRQRAQIPHRHKIRAMRLNAQPPHGKPGSQDVVKMTDRHRFGFGRAVDVHKLGQHILHLLVGEKLLGFNGRHGHVSGLFKR